MISSNATTNNPSVVVPTYQPSVWSDFTGYATFAPPTLTLSSTVSLILTTAPLTSTWSEFTGF